MKLVNRCFFLLCLWSSLAQAQPSNPCARPNQAQLSCTFLAIDVLSNDTVDAFCVGRPVRFELCPGRGSIPASALTYGVLPGVNQTFINAPIRCYPDKHLPYTYTPQAVGPVTVSELANDNANDAYYIRNFKVHDTPLPVFTVDPCPGGSALVTVTNDAYDSYKVQAGTGLMQDITYNQPMIVSLAGATSVTVTGRYKDTKVCVGTATQPVGTLAPAVKPTLTSLTLSDPLPSGTATLAVGNLPAGYRYTLQVDTGTGFQDVVPRVTVQPGSPSFPVPGTVKGRYRIARADYCGGSPDESVAIGTLSVTGTSANNRNQLLLDDARGPRPGTDYTVTRNGAAVNLASINGGRGLEDTDVQCGIRYTYVVTATQPGGGVAISNSFTITTESNLVPPQPRLVASFNLNNVVVLTPTLATSTLPAGSSLHYTGSGAAADFGKTVASLRAPRDSTDLTTLRARPPCYSVTLVDTCGNISPTSPATCPAILSARAADADGSTAALTWTAFTGPDPTIPAVYTLQRLAADGTVLSTVAVTGNTYTDLTPPTDRQVLRYRLQISGAGLLTGTFSYSNLASVTRQLTLTIPTAFTPNGDGLNDVLEVKGKYLNNYTFVVVDRNGQQVFRGTQRSDTWDGTIKGHAPVLGAYVWRFQQNNEDGKPFSATGSVTILK